MDMSKPQLGASSSSSSSSIHSFTHDVFLSFRGLDTRNNFTGHLHNNLVKEGINTFIDNDLTRGEDIKKELLQVIEGSRISIVIFSANYASSKRCLDELEKIFQCKESKQQVVYPIFYKVDPSEIRHQKGQVGEDIARLSKHKDYLEKVENWKTVLTQAATLSGWHIKDGEHEANVIYEIVKWISTKIRKHTLLDVAPYLVGIESRVEEMLKLLNVGEEDPDPHMIGIWGNGGMGKTTLAKAVYNSISHNFERCCFLANVREESFSPGGLVKLQNHFLSKIIHRDPPEVIDVDEGITVLKQNLRQKRVLLVLDDVDDLDQLRKLAGGCHWFGPRSRVIITTRNKHCLISHKVHRIDEVKELNDQEALELFKFSALKGNKCMDDYSEFATQMISYATGIPLVLEVLGLDLSSKDTEDWEDALKYYNFCKSYPNQQVQQVLKRSYEALEHPVNEVFLHLACLFKGYGQSYVIDVLESCELNPIYSLNILQERALIKIEDNSIWMHDLIEDMGKEIVRRESPNVAGRRSRLWLYEDVRDVLEENKGTDQIKAIVLRNHFSSEKIQLNGGSFTNMKNLQILSVGDSVIGGESVDYLPDQLRYLDWRHCRLRSLPTSFDPRKMGMLRMGGPFATQLVKERLEFMPFLISIKLDWCHGLTRIPDLSRLTRLKELEVSGCDDLVEVDPSVGRLDKLVNLTIQWCGKLKRFREKINLKSLETLVLSYCFQLEFFPEIEGDMKSLKSLNLRRTVIKELPCSVGSLTGLKSLSLECCRDLTDVPSSIFYELHSLEELDLSDCSNLVTFPTKSETLAPPLSSTTRTRLKVDLSRCHRLKEVSEFPLEIHELNVTDCESLERISKLSKILEGKDSKMFGELNLTDCKRLCSNLAARGPVLSAVEEADEMMGEAEEEEAEEEQETEEMFGDAEELTDLWALFLSCPKWEEFQVEFPIGIPIPKRFTYRQEVNLDVNWDDDEIPDDVIKTEHEFCIEIPQNCKGLALCMEGGNRRKIFGEVVYSINGFEFGTCCMEEGEGRVHYIPLVTVKRKLSECGMPPANDMFRVKVMFSFEYGGCCGVHLIEDSEGEGHQVTNMSSQPPSISTLYKRGTDQIKAIVLRDQFSSENKDEWKDELEYYTEHPIQDLEEISERIQVASFLKTTNIEARRVSTINELLKKMATELFQQKSANKLPRLHPTVRIAKAIIKKWSEPHGIPFNATELAEIPFLFMSALCHLSHIDLLRSDNISRPVEGFTIFKILTSLNFESCQFLKSFPEASGLPNLRNLNLDCCTSLVKIDDSVGFLEKLVDLSLSGCHNLIMFPRRIALKSVESINFRGCRRLKSLPEIVGEMELLTWLDLSGTAIKEVPSTIGYLINLEKLILRDCQKLTNLSCCIYELQHLWCLDLQYCTRLVTLPSWNAESLPKKSSISPDLWYINLRGCKRLQEIPELPPKVQWVNAADCVQLGRFAKLSNILVRKESEMIKCLLLSNCQKLYDNLAHDVAKCGRLLLNEVSLCSLFLSCTQNEFEVLFPGNEVPRWFSRNKHFNLLETSEVFFEIPRSFKLGNKGLAICAAFAVETTTPKQEDFMQSNLGDCTFTAKIDINGESTVTRSFSFESKDVASAHVWLCYIPFIMLAYRHSPPLKCGVHVEHISQGSVRCKSYGVHLVTPQDEDGEA